MLRTEKINGDLTVLSDTDQLCYGTDALFLAGYLKRAGLGAELGGGNGVVSLLAMARGKFSHIDCFELQETVAKLADENIRMNGMEEKITLYRKDIREIPSSFVGRYDCVFSNPPYMKVNAGKSCAVSEKQIARHETAGDIYDFCGVAGKLLKTGGEAVFVYRPDRLCALFEAMERAGIQPKRMTTVCEDPMHPPSMVLVSGKKGGGAGLYYSPVFFISRENGKKTEEYRKLMEEGIIDERFRNP